jgi:hypothetical protein
MAGIPQWAEAELVVTYGPLLVGVFPSSKPWAPRHKERRFLCVEARDEEGFNLRPNGGTFLPSLRESGSRWSEHQGVTVRAAEAEGHSSVTLLGGGQDWVVVVAADSWVAVGPTATAPDAVQVGPHVLD